VLVKDVVFQALRVRRQASGQAAEIIQQIGVGARSRSLRSSVHDASDSHAAVSTLYY
jgi:hypothetical protein